MEYVIIEASGRQFRGEPKKFIEINRLPLKVGSTIVIKRVLFVKKKKANTFIGFFLSKLLYCTVLKCTSRRF